MVKMILTVPRNFDVEYFCHVVTALVNDGKEDYDWTDYDLGECVTGRESLRDLLDGEFEYEIDAELVDFETVEVIQKLQKLCPEVGFYFENSGYSKEELDAIDDEFFYYELHYELLFNKGVSNA